MTSIGIGLNPVKVRLWLDWVSILEIMTYGYVLVSLSFTVHTTAQCYCRRYHHFTKFTIHREFKECPCNVTGNEKLPSYNNSLQYCKSMYPGQQWSMNAILRWHAPPYHNGHSLATCICISTLDDCIEDHAFINGKVILIAT